MPGEYRRAFGGSWMSFGDCHSRLRAKFGFGVQG